MSKSDRPFHQVAVVGAGHWGPNLIRNFDNKLRSSVRWVADQDPDRLQITSARFPAVRVTTDPLEAMEDPAVDAVVIATPTITHYDLVKAALDRGKDVFVEKPLTADLASARELVETAKRNTRVLLVGHIFVYNPAVQWVKEQIEKDRLGRIYYLSSSRTNLGPIRVDVNAAWDLAAQDLSIFDYWLGTTPISASALGGNWINSGLEDAVFATVRYPNDILAHLHVSWLNPRKVRDITVVAEQRMLTYDDLNLSEPIRVYDKSISDQRSVHHFVDTFASFRSSIREGEVVIPPVKLGEPLRLECEHFLDCIEQRSRPRTGGPEALAVIATLEAIQRSMRNSGREEEI